MSGRQHKKIRRVATVVAEKRFIETIANLQSEPFRARFRLAMKILFGRKP